MPYNFSSMLIEFQTQLVYNIRTRRMQHCKFLICLATLVSNYSLVIDFVAYRDSVKPLNGIIIIRANAFSSDGIERELQQRLHLPQVIVKNVPTTNLQSFMNISSVALIFISELDKPLTWALVAESLTKHSLIPMIFAIEAVPPLDVQLKFFNYFRQLNMLNTVVLFRENETMMARTYLPYPKVQVIAVEPRNFSAFVWPKYQNVFGYNFHLSVFDDPPIAYKQVTNNRIELGGLIGQLFSVFLKRVNGTFTVIDYPINDTMKRSIDMIVNLGFRIDLVHRSMEPCYPVFQTQVCLMLPVESDIPVSWYLLYVFDISTWQALGFSFLIIAVLKIVINRNHSNNRDLVLHVLSVLQLLLGHSILLPGIRSVMRALFTIYFGGLFVVIVSVYGGSLTSMFSTRVRMPAVRTPEDFLQTGLMIMATETERQIYFDTKLLPTTLMPRLYDIGTATITNANISFAYLMTSDKWLWYEKRQMHLKHPLFRITTGNLCTPSILQSFAVQKQSPFKNILKLIFLELHEFGLIDHWLAEVPPTGKFQLNNETGWAQVPLSLTHFTLGFYILGVGWMLALVIFLSELIICRRCEVFASSIKYRLENTLGRS